MEWSAAPTSERANCDLQAPVWGWPQSAERGRIVNYCFSMPSDTIEFIESPDESGEWRDLGTTADEEEEVQIEEYDLTSIPNDFNILTIFNFVDSGAVRIPGFQRNYVW